MLLLSPQYFSDYELIDCGNFEKLERFGKTITIRPEPQAVWDKTLPEKEWEKTAHLKFIPKSSSTGDWKKLKPTQEQWKITYQFEKDKNAVFNLRLGLTAFKHVVFFQSKALIGNIFLTLLNS